MEIDRWVSQLTKSHFMMWRQAPQDEEPTSNVKCGIALNCGDEVVNGNNAVRVLNGVPRSEVVMVMVL